MEDNHYQLLDGKDVSAQMKKEMAEELLKNFVHEMHDLGFQKGEIIEQIADYEEE